MSERVVRVGFLGAASIAWQAWAGIRNSGLVVTRVGCRNAERGQQFVKDACRTFQIDAADAPSVCTYEELVAADDVDVVYIAIPVTTREKWVKECVAHKKHVIGEKPPAKDAEQLRMWIEALDAQDLLYMDGTMMSHSQRMKDVCAAVKKLGGPVKHIYATFCWTATPEFMANDIRFDPALEPHGSLGDIGWYCIRYILHIMDFEMPTEVTGRILQQHERGGIIGFAGDMKFEVDGVPCIASIYCSFKTAYQQVVHVATTEGTLRVDDFAFPNTTRSDSLFYEVHNSSHDEVCVAHNVSTTITHTVPNDNANNVRDAMWRDVARVLREEGEGEHKRLKADPEESRYWATIAWKTQAVMDKMLESARQTSGLAPATA
ncbi:oxidoreductase-like protein [Leptomonas pyrrhocoris]|uniref:Oxidoreductase-like protein n=1 Tax=Leptomonas pyrrhocoris TaxID=157538 RepID=A0A0M9G7K5_LEPPY|nr:oxidoreductase-like protein [Leptomonas pyrrhocoris]XP_015662445.1 oxidoreductase-like protein [Leptomonas pyrrhocoris]KPA84005.1 oxidoreductase-like protein [Leptomonas pyrrhocoris]KPA84006.1 oxidoreductase-like protein [Leptomonas pyrrhocoris]|eukprot:XP_015662444.1 oxidoreductase-like protein [Leptomonas pyrrhocoris]